MEINTNHIKDLREKGYFILPITNVFSSKNEFRFMSKDLLELFNPELYCHKFGSILKKQIATSVYESGYYPLGCGDRFEPKEYFHFYDGKPSAVPWCGKIPNYPWKSAYNIGVSHAAAMNCAMHKIMELIFNERSFGKLEQTEFLKWSFSLTRVINYFQSIEEFLAKEHSDISALSCVSYADKDGLEIFNEKEQEWEQIQLFESHNVVFFSGKSLNLATGGEFPCTKHRVRNRGPRKAITSFFHFSGHAGIRHRPGLETAKNPKYYAEYLNSKDKGHKTYHEFVSEALNKGINYDRLKKIKQGGAL